MSGDSERLGTGPEIKVGSPEAAQEQQEKLANKNETGIESPRDADMLAERARVEALETAISVEAGGKEKDKTAEPTKSTRRGPISKKTKGS